MSEMRNLAGIKVGDQVFVVRQRLGPTENSYWAVVEKVGRKYGYVYGPGGTEAFCLDTGASHHGSDSSNTRANRYGFDVYVSEEAYEKEVYEAKELKRLGSRLFNSWGRLTEFPPPVVNAIHKILDDAGLRLGTEE